MSELKNTVDAGEKISSTLSALIPQLFFDLIARLIPGLAIVWSFYLALLGGTLFNVDDLLNGVLYLLPKNAFFLLCITIVAFYVTSIAFYGLWAVSVHTMCFLKNKFKKCDEGSKNRFVEVLEASTGFSFRHDYIKIKAPIAGNLITKLKAEIHMSGALTATFVICVILSIIGYAGSTLSNVAIFYRTVFFLVGAIGFYFSNRHFSKRLYRSVGSYSELLGYDKKRYSFPDTM